MSAHREGPELNAWVQRFQGAEGPLRVALKDNIDQAGVVCAAGCRAYADRVPREDAEVVRRLKAAGAVIVGRTAMHELADGVTSENPWTGFVHNPHRRGYSPGGSSGGSAAVVAAGEVEHALGTDTGGSVRIPASLCGVVGLKPTRGRVPTAGVVPLSTTLDHVGTLTRSVAQARWMLQVIADEGMDPPPAETGLEGARLGLLSGFGVEVEPGVEDLLQGALRSLREAGARVVPVEVEGLERGIRLLSSIYPREAAAWHARILDERPQDISEAVRADLLRGRRGDGARYRAALAEAEELRRRVDAALEGVDALLCPTTPTPAKPHGSPGTWVWLAHTVPFNLTGHPALSVPMGEVDGLPVGLQLVGRGGEDLALLALGEAWERR